MHSSGSIDGSTARPFIQVPVEAISWAAAIDPLALVGFRSDVSARDSFANPASSDQRLRRQ
jgi:hypothetical protein